jgi:hypothetical protein
MSRVWRGALGRGFHSKPAGTTTTAAVPKRMTNHVRDVLRLYRALLREGQRKGCRAHVRGEFRRRAALQDPVDSRMADTRYRIGLMELERLQRAERVTMKSV